jgi:transcriptional regulator with XRE-family HTH domain
MHESIYLAGVSRVGAALRELREDRFKLSQRDFAAKVGLSQARVSTYESGDKLPTLDVVRRIAAELGVDEKEVDPEGEAYSATKPRPRLQALGARAHHRRLPESKEVTMEDQRRFEFVSLYDALIRNPNAQEELIGLVRRFVGRKLGNG